MEQILYRYSPMYGGLVYECESIEEFLKVASEDKGIMDVIGMLDIELYTEAVMLGYTKDGKLSFQAYDYIFNFMNVGDGSYIFHSVGKLLEII